MNLSMLLEMAAGAAGDRGAVTNGDVTVTSAQLHARAGAAGRALKDLGVENVAFLGLNSPTVPVLMFASAAAGLPFVPLNYRLTDEQLGAALDRLGATVLVTDDEQGGRLTLPSHVREVSVDDVDRWGERDDVVPCDGFDVDGEDVAVKLFTSGTTGPPKTALLRHRHLTSYIVGTVEFLGCEPDEAILISVPNYHIAGLSSVLSSTYSGRRMVQLSAFTPQAWVDTAAQQDVTHAMVVPTMLGRILDVLQERGETLPSLRSLSYGGGRMPVAVLERALALLPNVDFVNAYGLTETSSTIALLAPEDHRVALASDDPAVRARLSSVGRPLPSVELEVRDEDGNAVPNAMPGEIFVRGDQIAGEYSSHSALTADGWYPTRDRGFLDADGFLFLDGRADDVIVRGGENISPGEVEDVLLQHPAIREAAIVGMPDPEWGERIEAAVVLQDDASLDEAELQGWVRERLRSTRVPSRVVAFEELPHNETGKLLRRTIKERLAALVTNDL